MSESKCHIATYYCSDFIKERIAQLCEIIEKKSLLPFKVVIHSDLFRLNMEKTCVYFVEANLGQMRNMNVLMQNISLKDNPIVLIANEKNNYFDLAIQYSLSNILHKDNLDEYYFCGLLKRFFLKSDGISPFFDKDNLDIDFSYTLSGTIQIRRLTERIFSGFLEKIPVNIRSAFIMQSHEIILNALAYGVLGITAKARDLNIGDVERVMKIPQVIPSGKEISIHVVVDKEKYGISVIDKGGSLRRERILEKIRRQSIGIGETIPQGVMDINGRGLYILCNYGHLMFSIKTHKQTKVSFFSHFRAEKTSPVFLLISESNN